MFNTGRNLYKFKRHISSTLSINSVIFLYKLFYIYRYHTKTLCFRKLLLSLEKDQCKQSVAFISSSVKTLSVRVKRSGHYLWDRCKAIDKTVTVKYNSLLHVFWERNWRHFTPQHSFLPNQQTVAVMYDFNIPVRCDMKLI